MMQVNNILANKLSSTSYKMVEKMFLVVLSLILLANGTNLFKPDHIFGHMCMKGLGFAIQDVSLSPWPPSLGDSSELKVSGIFEQNAFN